MLINQAVDAYDRKTDTYIVAYIDLLGVTNKIIATDQQLTMNKLHNLYTYSMDITRRIQIEEYRDIQFKIFSDNIIIAKKISSEPEQRMRDIRCLLMCAGSFQARAAGDSVGWLMRGGISIGQLFIDEVMVWDDALLTSYYLEDKIANYPRIILDKSVINEIAQDKQLSIYIRKDFDNLYFLNYLNNCDCHNYGTMLMNGFEKMQADAKKKLNEKIYQKLCWHMNYVNSMITSQDNTKDNKFQLLMNLEL